MKKIVILGASGMAGHMISKYFNILPEKYEVYTICHQSKLEEASVLLDIFDLKDLDTILKNIKPNAIINCIGILNKNAESNCSDAIFINSFFPRYLEKTFRNSGIKIIHISTDCVFSGERGGYSEACIPDGKDIYARTKILGEINNNKDLTVRTSIIGPELKNNGIGLFHWFMQQQDIVKGYSKVMWSGITTLQLAKSLHLMLEKNLEGLYNLTVKKPVSKYELLKIMSLTFNRNIIIEDCREPVNDKSLISIRSDFSMELPSYEEMLQELKRWMEKNKELYWQYFYKEEI